METKWGNLSLETVRSRAANLAQQREWDQFHTPRNLLSALVGEVGDLSECFQWKGEVTENLEGFSDSERVHVGEEMADVLMYLVRMADKAGIDLPSVVGRRMDLNAGEHPADVANGSAGRHTELTDSPVGAASARASGAVVDADDGPVAELAWTVSVLKPSAHRQMYDLGEQGLVAGRDCFFEYGESWLECVDSENRVASFTAERAHMLLGHRPKVFIEIRRSSGSHRIPTRDKLMTHIARQAEFDPLVVVDDVLPGEPFGRGTHGDPFLRNNPRPGTSMPDGTVRSGQIGSSQQLLSFNMDILDEEAPENLLESIRSRDIPLCYPIVHGTVALEEIYERKREIAELDGYVSHVRRLFKGRFGLFIVTSGFLSVSELLTLFKAPFQLRARLRHLNYYSSFGYSRRSHKPRHPCVTLCFECSAQ